jgi:hypothetical protein
MDRAAHPVEATASTMSDRYSAAFDEKPSRHPSTSSSKSTRRAPERVANQLHEKEEHVTEDEEEGPAAEPVHSKSSAEKDASPIPDGGFQAWLQVMGSFFLLFNSWYVPKGLVPHKLGLVALNLVTIQPHETH